MDRREAWRERAQCCDFYRFSPKNCKNQATCWVVDPKSAPHRKCKQVNADDCPQKFAAGKGWESRDACCKEGFHGKGCREFPGTCYEMMLDSRNPYEACKQIKGVSQCAAKIETKRKGIMFYKHLSCCAAVLPEAGLNATMAANANGCPFSCWSKPARAQEPHRECIERKADPKGCGFDVKSRNHTWGTKDACCLGAYGKRGCRRYPDTCWVKKPPDNSKSGKTSPDRACVKLTTPRECAAKEDSGVKLLASEEKCCATNFGAGGCKAYPAKCFARHSSKGLPDRTCVPVNGKAECAKVLDGKSGAVTKAECCKGFKGGCKTFPSTCFSPAPLDSTFPDKVGALTRVFGVGRPTPREICTDRIDWKPSWWCCKRTWLMFSAARRLLMNSMRCLPSCLPTLLSPSLHNI
jgi:hypothetical protein